MQALRNATHVVMDKTGTLTEGRLEVITHDFADGLKLNQVLCYQILATAEIEEARVHPVAQAVFKWALSSAQSNEQFRVPLESRNHTRELGKGVKCEVRVFGNEWILVHLGTSTFLAEQGISTPDMVGNDVSAATVVYFALDKRYSGCLHVRVRFVDQQAIHLRHVDVN